MKNLTKLIFISTILHQKTDEKGMGQPNWLKHFLLNLNKDRYYQGSVLYRYLWDGDYYFQLEVPSDSRGFSHLISQRGEFLKWSNNSFQRFLDEREQETVIWEYL